MGTGIALLLGLFLAMVGLAPSAFAHHPELTASAACGPTANQYVISYTSTADVQAVSRDNPQIDIYWGLPAVTWPSTGGAAPADSINAATGSYASPTWSFSGEFTVTVPAGTTQIEVIAHAVGTFRGTPGPADGGTGQWTGTSGNTNSPFTVNLPSDCARASASPSVECAASDKIVLTFTATHATTAAVTKNGDPVLGTATVSNGSTFEVALAPGDENTDVTLVVDYANSVPDQTLTVPVDCETPPAPDATVTWTCAVDDATVTLTNTGQEPVTATITKNDVAVHTNVAVPGVYLVPITDADENTDVTIKVTFSDAGTATDVVEVLPVDCTTPNPAIGSPVCAEGGLSITLSNPLPEGTETAEFTIVIDGDETIETVASGASKVILIPVAEDAEVSVSITSGAVSYVNQSLLRDCAEPNLGLVSVVKCASRDGIQGINVTIANSGGQDGTATVTPTVGGVLGSGVVFNVPALGSVTEFIAVGEDVGYSLTFAGDLGAAQPDETGTNNCSTPPPPPPPPVDVCPDMVGNQPTGTDCTPPPVDVCPDMAGDQPTGTDCTPPPVDVCPDMVGNQPTGTDCTPPPVDVCPDMAGDQPTGTDCSEVLGEVVTPTPTPAQVAGAQLPRTGADPVAPLASGLTLVLLGLVLVVGGRRGTPRTR